MKRLLLPNKVNPVNQKNLSRKDFIKFVANELSRIAKKNLKIPVSLYHL